MLRREYGMASHRRLPAVAPGACRGDARADEVLRMAPYSLNSDAPDVGPLPGVQPEAAAERRPPQPLKRRYVSVLAHGAPIVPHRPLKGKTNDFGQPVLFDYHFAIQ